MHRSRTTFFAATLLFLILGSMTARAELQAGDPAPDFRLPGSDGKIHQLSDYKGKKAVILAFFPKAFTGG